MVLCVCEPVLILTTVSLFYAFIFLSAFTVPAEGVELALVSL